MPGFACGASCEGGVTIEEEGGRWMGLGEGDDENGAGFPTSANCADSAHSSAPENWGDCVL